MKQLRYWSFIPAFCVLALTLKGQTLSLQDDAMGTIGGVAEVALTLDSTDEVQGLVAVFQWDDSIAIGTGLAPGAAIASADTRVTRVEDSFAAIGVVMDSDGMDGEVVMPGSGLDVATLELTCGDTPGSSPIQFVDDTHPMVDGGPLLENIVVIGGLSIGQIEGLMLSDGEVECKPIPDRFFLAGMLMNDVDNRSNCGTANVMMENTGPVEGYVAALCHPEGLTLNSINVGQAAVDNGFDFSASAIMETGGYLGVVMDLVEPFDGNVIPAGVNQIGVFEYCCDELPAFGEDPICHDLTFCDMVLGDPLKENVIVKGGRSIGANEGLVLENGEFCCKGLPIDREICDNGVDDDQNGLADCDDPACADFPGCRETDCDDGVDNDGDGDVDCDDPDCFSQAPCVQQQFACGSRELDENGLPETPQGAVGGDVEVCFYVRSPEDNVVGQHAQFDHIQGFSMAVTYCCDLTARPEFDTSGTILEAVGAEFVDIQVDNNPDDGDGCELVIGVLVDALPPFDGNTIPPLDDLQLMGCVTFAVADDDTLCGTCCPIEFTDGINGAGKIPIKNLISVENESRSPQLIDCEVCIVEKERFFRGDCNFSRMGMGMAVDIADAAAVISFLFLPGTWKFQPPCLDACDCNDDGRIDLADAMCILNFLFRQGRFPPDPGPGIIMVDDGIEFTEEDIDPTEDKLDCSGGNGCPSA